MASFSANASAPSVLYQVYGQDGSDIGSEDTLKPPPSFLAQVPQGGHIETVQLLRSAPVGPAMASAFAKAQENGGSMYARACVCVSANVAGARLSEMFPLLAKQVGAGGQVFIAVFVTSHAVPQNTTGNGLGNGHHTSFDTQSLSTMALLSGFVDGQLDISGGVTITDRDTGMESGIADKGDGGGCSFVEFTCRKPAWKAGAVSRGLKLKKKTKTKKATSVQQWQSAANDGGEDDLIDDDDLLEGFVAPVATKVKKSDCSTKRRACANCSCGRAEMEREGNELTEEQLQQTTSACGNCHKGDAYRCSTCPHLGKPAYEPGVVAAEGKDGKMTVQLMGVDDMDIEF